MEHKIKLTLLLVLVSLGGYCQNIKTEYAAKVISTNFTIPIMKFTFTDALDRKGNVSFFSHVGAGVGYYWGRITEMKDEKGEILSSDMDNIFGIQAGFLFSSNSNGGSNSNMLSATGGISILNFQLGIGYELGTVMVGEKRTFMTLTYGIPIAKLVRGAFYKISSKELNPVQRSRGFLKF